MLSDALVGGGRGGGSCGGGFLSIELVSINEVKYDFGDMIVLIQISFLVYFFERGIGEAWIFLACVSPGTQAEIARLQILLNRADSLLGGFEALCLEVKDTLDARAKLLGGQQ